MVYVQPICSNDLLSTYLNMLYTCTRVYLMSYWYLPTYFISCDISIHIRSLHSIFHTSHTFPRPSQRNALIHHLKPLLWWEPPLMAPHNASNPIKVRPFRESKSITQFFPRIKKSRVPPALSVCLLIST